MEKIRLNMEQKAALLKTVHAVIGEKLYGRNSTPYPSLEDIIFSKQFGLFVTLTIDGNLRGCIGYVEGFKPIREAVKEMAIEAAFHDPRFHPLQKDEYKFVSVEISILYPIEKVKDFSEIQVGRDGLIMERGFHRGLLLPQVATEYGWNREEFMNHTCQKAGLENACWKNGADVYKFEAEVFNEMDIA